LRRGAWGAAQKWEDQECLREVTSSRPGKNEKKREAEDGGVGGEKCFFHKVVCGGRKEPSAAGKAAGGERVKRAVGPFFL